MGYKNKSYPLRIPQIYREKLSYIAGEFGRSLNSEIEFLIKKRILSYEEKRGEITPRDIEEFIKNKKTP